MPSARAVLRFTTISNEVGSSHRQLGRPRALEDLAHVDGGAPGQIGNPRPVGQERAGVCVLGHAGHNRDVPGRRQLGEERVALEQKGRRGVMDAKARSRSAVASAPGAAGVRVWEVMSPTLSAPSTIISL